MTGKKETFRQSILENDDECLVFGADNLSQFTRPAGHIAAKCERALACATQTDIVLLKDALDQGYQSWLRSLGLGTDHVVTYGTVHPEKRLSELVLENPGPVKTACLFPLAVRQSRSPGGKSHGRGPVWRLPVPNPQI